jgi:dolichol-phosphate mannosyltransferase
MSSIIVAMPAYNEAKYVGDIVRQVSKYADRVLVMDDGSTDETSWEALSAGAEVINHICNRGYGSAIQDSISYAWHTDSDILVIIDADGQHYPEDIPALVKKVDDGYDLVIGRRASSDVPFYRRIGGTVLSVATWMLSGVWVKDSQCGFRAYSRRAVEVIRPRENGMPVGSEVIGLAAWAGLRITEVPISVRYLEDSSTHNPWKQGMYTLWRIGVMIVRRRLWK